MIGRTNKMVLHTRIRLQMSMQSVRNIWELCCRAASKYGGDHKTALHEQGYNTTARIPTSIIDEKMRMGEKSRLSGKYSLPLAVPRAAGARQTQGHRMLAALTNSSAGHSSKTSHSAQPHIFRNHRTSHMLPTSRSLYSIASVSAAAARHPYCAGCCALCDRSDCDHPALHTCKSFSTSKAAS